MEHPTCSCKFVFLVFICGHEFTRTHSCNAIHDSSEQPNCVGQEIVFGSHEKCMECISTTMRYDESDTVEQTAANLLGECGESDRHAELLGFYEDEDGRLGYNFGYKCEDIGQMLPENYHRNYCDLDEQTWRTVSEHGASESEECQVAYQDFLEKKHTDDPETFPGDELNPQYASSHRVDITGWSGEDFETSRVGQASTELVTEWLRAEVTDAPIVSHPRQKNHALMNPVGPIQDIDDPYDTSASSCGRSSKGTMKQYIPGINEEPGSAEQPRKEQAKHGTLESIPSINSMTVYRCPHLGQPRPYTWPHNPTIHITKPQPPAYTMVARKSPRLSLAKKFQASILQSYETIFKKICTKKGIDGRPLRRRSLTLTLESRIVRKLSRRGSRAERKADGLRSRMLRKTYDRSGFFEVVVDGSFRSGFNVENDNVGRGCSRSGTV